jgi:hypothetical protein
MQVNDNILKIKLKIVLLCFSWSNLNKKLLSAFHCLRCFRILENRVSELKFCTQIIGPVKWQMVNKSQKGISRQIMSPKHRTEVLENSKRLSFKSSFYNDLVSFPVQPLYTFLSRSL